MILCVPGTFGTVSDFDWLTLPHVTIDLFNDSTIPSSFDDTADFILTVCRKHKITNAIGYSLGGRLLLHALSKDPSYFEKVMLLASHTGITSVEEKTLRAQIDEGWARALDNEPFENVLHRWNTQPFFKHDSEINKPGHEFQIPLLKKAFTGWSFAKQEDLLPKLTHCKSKLLYCVGEYDEKYLSVGESAKKALPQLSVTVLKGAGHRIIHHPALLELTKTYFNKFASSP